MQATFRIKMLSFPLFEFNYKIYEILESNTV